MRTWLENELESSSLGFWLKKLCVYWQSGTAIRLPLGDDYGAHTHTNTKHLRVSASPLAVRVSLSYIRPTSSVLDLLVKIPIGFKACLGTFKKMFI